MKATYTVIIPTMYFHKEKLQNLLNVFESCDYIKEVLIINNNKAEKCSFISSKQQTLGVGINLYVNASWRLGVRLSMTENIILCNDDLELGGNLNDLLLLVELLGLEPRNIFGPNLHCFEPPVWSNEEIKIRQSKKINNGYGTFMIMQKQTFLATIIPRDLRVWFGDNCLFNQNETYSFDGFPIRTKHSGTSSKLDLKGVNAAERKIYERSLQ